MSKEDMIELEGVVTEMLPESRFRVHLDNGLDILAYGSGKIKLTASASSRATASR